VTEHFNQLTPAEAERLAILAEEAGEIVQAVGKILRHGYESYHPDDPRTSNRQHLERELGDLSAIVYDMCRREDLSPAAIESQRHLKLGRLEAGTLYLHHQREEPR
jgi:NTP pyrophosphatase (non-canonical NTP hydrolase)